MFKKVRRFCHRIACLFGKHDWHYFYGNYQTNKDVYKCNYCGQEKEN